MGKQLQAVMYRRQELLTRISVQREQLQEAAESLQPAFLFADCAVQTGRLLRAHPVLVVVLTVLLVVRRKGMSALLKGTWRIWKAYRYFSDYSRKLTSRT